MYEALFVSRIVKIFNEDLRRGGGFFIKWKFSMRVREEEDFHEVKIFNENFEEGERRVFMG